MLITSATSQDSTTNSLPLVETLKDTVSLPLLAPVCVIRTIRASTHVSIAASLCVRQVAKCRQVGPGNHRSFP